MGVLVHLLLPVWELLGFCIVLCNGWSLLLILIIFISTISFVFRQHFSKKSLELSSLQIELIESELLKVLPVESSNGWFLEGMFQGVRVFQKEFSAISRSQHKKLFSCSTLVDASPKHALISSLSVKGFPSWFASMTGVGVVVQSSKPFNNPPLSGDTDVIALKLLKKSSLLKKVLQLFCGIVRLKAGGMPNSLHSSEEKLRRNWKVDGKRFSLMMCPTHPSIIPYDYALFLFSDVPNHKDVTAVTVVALSSVFTSVITQKVITFQLCALRDHVLMKEVLGTIRLPVSPKTANTCRSKEIGRIDKTFEEELLASKSEIKERRRQEDIPYTDPDHRYLQIAMKCAKDLLSVTNAKEKDGWIASSNKGVVIMKKIPAKGDPPVNCVKGTMIINVPPDFLLRILMNPVHSTALDDMLKETEHVKQITPSVKLLHLIYKAVWPTAARDFAVCNVVGMLDHHTRVHAACSIIDECIPELKGCVRADVIAGGYCIRDVPGNANSSEVTYVTQVDLKGNVPTFVVNKIVESQPQCVNQFKNIALREYSKLRNDPVKCKELEENYPIYPIFQSETFPDSDTASTPSAGIVTEANNAATKTITIQAEVTNENPPVSSTSDAPLENDLGGDTVHNAPVSLLLDRLPQFKLDDDGRQCNSSPVCHDNTSLLEYPRSDGAVDFRTLSNQIAAKMLEEMFNVSGLDLLDPCTYRDQGGWNFQGIEKDVAIFRKKVPDSPFYSFLGRGLIDLPTQEVFNCVRNPNQRFTYDNMLKELHVVKQIEEGLYVLRLQHEATQCFLKQSRDFCLLVCERSEPNKKMVIGSSVDIPECPPLQGVTRGKIMTSGWVIEPYRKDEKLCTQVTYSLQVDVGGLPAPLVNFVARRQPLAVAYIREFLESTSLSVTSNKGHKGISLLSHQDEDDYGITPIRYKI